MLLINNNKYIMVSTKTLRTQLLFNIDNKTIFLIETKTLFLNCNNTEQYCYFPVFLIKIESSLEI